MALTIGALLALLGIAVAAYPFLRRRFLPELPSTSARMDLDDPPEEEPSTSDTLQSIYDSIRTLQLERELGNIPGGLYREQLNAFRIQAATILREREQAVGEDRDWSLEEEIRVARAGLYRPSDGGLPCPNCGSPVPAGIDICQECEAIVRPRAEVESIDVKGEENG